MGYDHSVGSSGISATTASAILTGEALATSHFGYSVSLGDVNGDGYVDAIVGAQQYSTNTGRVYTFHSASSSGIVATGALSASAILTGEANSNFGAFVH